MKRLFLLLICISALFHCQANDSEDTGTPAGYAEMSGSLNEVVVTASELKSLSSTSVIGRDAMQHLQPTNVGDLMELLPGGIAKDPALTDVNTASLRETGTIGATGNATVNTNYMTNALGTLFLVDGAPINTDADMQYTNGAAATASTGVKGIANSGVDMRTISTDDIESVEVIRGIPSVEYGNLTSGVMNIKKIRRPTRLKARFKADDKSQLVSLGKGFALDSAQNYVMNIDGGFLNAYSDITNPLDNYKRANASVRLTAQASTEHTDWTFTPAVDYTGSFDNSKVDPDLSYGGINTFRSDYHRLSAAMGAQVQCYGIKFFKGASLNAGLTQEFDYLERQLLVSPTRAGIAPSTTEPGEYDAYLLFKPYVANYAVDGKPFTAFAKASADFEFNSRAVRNHVKAGLEWDMSKNFGKGPLYDMSHPLSASGWGARPRAYNTIPALNSIAFYLQDQLTARINGHTIDVRAGVRATGLLGLDSEYAMAGKLYWDPRLNAQWTSPYFGKKEDYSVSLSAGIGSTTRMPTVSQIYPDPVYIDIIQLGYYSQSHPEEYSRYNIISYCQIITNYNLAPARNLKWEVRADFELAGNRLWLSFFNEKMTSGFRQSNNYGVYEYKKYDASVIEDSKLTDKPDLSKIPYSVVRKLDGYSYVTNGSDQDKMGVEFEFTSVRIKPLCTSIKFSGAWFRSTYRNSQPMYYPVSAVIDNTPLSDMYVGLYVTDDGRINEQLSTNLLFDTQIPKWGLIFTTSMQAMWYVSTQRLFQDGRPTHYLSYKDGVLHEFTDKDVEENPVLKQLVRNINPASFERYTVPPAVYFNFKVTKNIGKWFVISMFVNKIINITPDFERNGILIRRSVSPYFGMEMTVKI